MCQVAVEAMPVTDEPKKVLKKLGQNIEVPNPSHLLAKVMADIIDKHLKGGI
jgi:hypothetical protein